MDFLTPEIFDALIVATIMVGLALAGVRLYRDFTRPLPGENREKNHEANRPDNTDREQKN